jgi:hypothetical protein
MSRSKRGVALTVAAGSLAAVLIAAAAYENPPVQKAARILPANLLSGEGFKVQSDVPTVGFMEQFTIDSDFGPYTVHGHDLVAVRVQEIAALRKLDEISQTEAFANAMGAAAKKTGKAVANAVTNPGDTVEGIPKGVGRFVGGVGKSAKKAGEGAVDKVSDDEEEKPPKGTEARKSASKAKRQLAKKFKVDPYSNNAPMQKKLDDLALAATAGGFAMSAVNPSALVSTVATVNDVVWDVPAPDLQEMDNKKLEKLGVEEKTRKALLANKFFTPTQETAFVDALTKLGEVKGADAAVALVARKASAEDDARFFRRSAEVLACAAKQTGPLATLEARENLFVARARSGAFVVPVGVDLLTWAQNVDTFSAAAVPDAKSRELWLSGRVTDEAKKELTARGWEVHEHALGSGCK